MRTNDPAINARKHIDLGVELAHYDDTPPPAAPELGYWPTDMDERPWPQPAPHWPASPNDTPDRCQQCERYMPPFTWRIADDRWLCDECRDMADHASRYPPST